MAANGTIVTNDAAGAEDAAANAVRNLLGRAMP
jgi:hypothetical protein